MSTRWARNFFGRLLGLKFVRALNNYSKWRRFWTSPVQVTKNLESSRLACTGIPSTTGSPKITKRSPNVERNYDGTHTCKGIILKRLVWLTGLFMSEQWQITVSVHIRLKRFNPQRIFLVHQHGHPFNVLHTNMAARVVICKQSLGSTVKRNCKFNCLFNFAGNASQEVHILCLRKWSIFLQSYFRPLLSVIRTKRPDLKQLRLLW